MKPAGMLLLNLAVVVGALAAYHLLFQSGGSDEVETGSQVAGRALDEREAMDRALSRSKDAFGQTYDETAMQKMVADAGVELTLEQKERVLPLLHAHLVILRRNLEHAREALLAGTPASQRSRYYARAAQEHGRFQSELRKILAPQQAAALFNACPPLFPPVPGSTAAGKTKPGTDPITGMPTQAPEGAKK